VSKAFTLIDRIVRAGPDRPTRLHDAKGNFVGWRRALLNGPRALASGIGRVLLRRWPERPWYSYAAADRIAAHLGADSRVLEFGSGRSTIWLARHAGHVMSVEHNPEWHALVTDLLRARGLTHVTYLLRVEQDQYLAVLDEPPAQFDLIIVDGAHRVACAKAGLPHLRPGGLLYIDNTDGELAEAERAVAAFAAQHGGALTYYTDFAPTQMYASQGLMYRHPPDHSRRA
jgi:Methyltransferase domain